MRDSDDPRERAAQHGIGSDGRFAPAAQCHGRETRVHHEKKDQNRGESIATSARYSRCRNILVRVAQRLRDNAERHKPQVHTPCRFLRAANVIGTESRQAPIDPRDSLQFSYGSPAGPRRCVWAETQRPAQVPRGTQRVMQPRPRS